MPNLRIVYDNAVARATSVTASTTVGSLVAANMLTEVKTEVHRSTGTSVSYTINWSSSQTIGCVSLPCTNLSPTALVTVNLYNSLDTLLSADLTLAKTGFISTTPHTVNDFALGKISKATLTYSTPINNIRKCIISIVDTNNTAGFIDCSKIVAGQYWEPTYNFENGVDLLVTDSSNTSRTNAGELVSDRGFLHDKIEFKFALLTDTDRDNLLKILREVGSFKNLLLILFPDIGANEHPYTIYGKRSNTSISHRSFGYYNHSMEITSW